MPGPEAFSVTYAKCLHSVSEINGATGARPAGGSSVREIAGFRMLGFWKMYDGEQGYSVLVCVAFRQVSNRYGNALLASDMRAQHGACLSE